MTASSGEQLERGRRRGASSPEARRLTAVSGSARMSGCTASGNRDDEKNTPEKIHIGSITRFMSPDTPSTVRGRAASSRPSEANASAESRQTPARTSERAADRHAEYQHREPEQQRHLEDEEDESRKHE